ncbi:dTDP-rhamnosyl transferase RfbF [Collimonas arenae]|uniref:dTDP-rhamnosyl transferase RfbF n=1 Tax=Collimonas arenae TaxID=279058 RepID=A0A0A1F8Q0_9BURK|nr:glycosyltransferase family 2 protein [Collimonas arenae]AIY40054.1 dTDP-rhamnosyl transferase RfbF [Collimonas arenae]
MTQLNKTGVAAIVVGYFPEYKIVVNLLKSLSSQVDYLILVDNGGTKEAYDFAQKEGLDIEYIQFEKNKGLGHALNMGFERAISLGVKYVATFDQDSAPTADLIGNLKKTHEKFALEGVNCAAVGPVFFDRRESNKTYFPFYLEEKGKIISRLPNNCSESYVETDALITSGMLVRADVWENGVHYDAGLFVDYTDTEWSFRARAKGYKLFGCLRIEMGHAPSDAPPARIFGLSFFRYSPLRRFYYFRNTVSFCRASYVSWTWKRRLTYGLTLRFFINILIDEKKLRSLKMMLVGICDGIRRKSGEFIG